MRLASEFLFDMAGDVAVVRERWSGATHVPGSPDSIGRHVAVAARTLERCDCRWSEAARTIRMRLLQWLRERWSGATGRKLAARQAKTVAVAASALP